MLRHKTVRFGERSSFVSGGPTSGHELQQGAVDLVGVGPGDGVRAAVDDHHLQVADQAGQPFAGLGVRQDMVVIALDNQHRHVDLRQVGAEVGLPRRDAGHRRGGRGGRGEVPAGLVGLVADQRAAELFDVVEVVQEPLHPRGSILPGGLHEPVEQARRQALWVVERLQQERWDRGYQHPLATRADPNRPR
jgi:hypothetical protein